MRAFFSAITLNCHPSGNNTAAETSFAYRFGRGHTGDAAVEPSLGKPGATRCATRMLRPVTSALNAMATRCALPQPVTTVHASAASASPQPAVEDAVGPRQPMAPVTVRTAWGMRCPWMPWRSDALYRCLARTADAVACPIAPGQWGANRDRWASVGERETPWLDLLAHAPCCDIAEMTHGDTSATGSLLQPQHRLGTPIFSADIARCSLTRRHQETARPRPAQPGNLVSPDAEPVTGSTPEPGMGLERGPSTSAGPELVAGPKPRMDGKIHKRRGHQAAP